MSQLESPRDASRPVASDGGAPRIRVLIVENHQLVSESLGILLESQNDIEVVGRASSVEEASGLPDSLSPDVVVADFHLNDGNGRDAVVAMRAQFANARYVFLSRDGSEDARLAAIEAGASAYVLKSGPVPDLMTAIRAAASGASLISPTMIAELVGRGKDRQHVRESLSQRELEVLQLLADGVPTREVAHRLGISYTTVRTHIRSISTKLGTRSMLNAVVKARELQLIS